MEFKYWFKKYKSLVLLVVALLVALAFLCVRVSRKSVELAASNYPESNLEPFASEGNFMPTAYLDRNILLPTVDFEISVPSEEVYSDSTLLVTSQDGVYLLISELSENDSFLDMISKFGEMDTFEDVDVSYSDSVSGDGYMGMYYATYSAGIATVQYKTKYIKWYCMRYEVPLTDQVSLCIMTLSSEKSNIATAKEVMDRVFESVTPAAGLIEEDSETQMEGIESETEENPDAEMVSERIGIYVREALESAYAVVMYDATTDGELEITLANSAGKTYSMNENFSSDGKAVFYLGECSEGLYTYTITAKSGELPLNEGKIMSEEDLVDFLSR